MKRGQTKETNETMCIGPQHQPYRYQVAVEHATKGAIGLFTVEQYVAPSHAELTQLMALVQVYVFSESFESFYARVTAAKPLHARITLDANIAEHGMEEVNEILQDLSDEGECYLLVPTGENTWEHLSMAEDPTAERVRTMLLLA